MRSNHAGTVTSAHRRRLRSVTTRLLPLVGVIVLAATMTSCTSALAAKPLNSAARPGSPSRWDFVKKTGYILTLDGRPFRFSGANIYWGGLDQNGRTSDNYPTPYRVQTALATVADMGETVVRCITCGVSTGNPFSVEPSLGVFNPTALKHIDYFVAQAQKYGIRLDIPLTSNWDYYMGGYRSFISWLGLAPHIKCYSEACATIFYTNPRAIAAFERYISVLLNHVNAYTGVPNKDNPTIMSWEIGNELAVGSDGPAVYTKWTSTIAAYIKSIASKQLVMDGSQNFVAGDLNVPDVDIESPHGYPLNNTYLNRFAVLDAAAEKATVVGEYQWDNQAQLPSYLADIQQDPGISGDIYWDLMPQNDDFGWVEHYDGYQLHFPGDNAAVISGGAPAAGRSGQLAAVLAKTTTRSLVAQLRDHAYAMSGRKVPPYQVPTAPVITNVEHLVGSALGTGNLVEWRGAAGAARYIVRRSTAGPHGPWTTVCTTCSDPNAEPFLDSGGGAGPHLWYQVTAVNPDGVAGPPSPVFQVKDKTLDDNLNDFSLAYSQSSQVTIDTATPSLFGGDTARARLWSHYSTKADIAWLAPSMQSFEAVLYFPEKIFWAAHNVQFLLSRNGVTWTTVPGQDVQINGGAVTAPQDAVPYLYTIDGVQTILRGASYVEVQWTNDTYDVPQVSEVRITHP